MVMNSDGSNIHQVTSDLTDVQLLAWSPDGSQIIFSAGETCEDLYKINLDGSGLQKLTNKPGDIYNPSLSPDGEWIAFAYSSCTGGTAGVVGQQVYLMRVDGHDVRLLTNKYSLSALDPSWFPLPGLEVGKTFAITQLGANLNLRSSSFLTSTVQTKIPEGEKILVIEGPVEANEYIWWRVRVIDTGQEGWVAENPGWFVPAGAAEMPTLTPTP